MGNVTIGLRALLSTFVLFCTNQVYGQDGDWAVEKDAASALGGRSVINDGRRAMKFDEDEHENKVNFIKTAMEMCESGEVDKPRRPCGGMVLWEDADSGAPKRIYFHFKRVNYRTVGIRPRGNIRRVAFALDEDKLPHNNEVRSWEDIVAEEEEEEEEVAEEVEEVAEEEEDSDSAGSRYWEEHRETQGRRYPPGIKRLVVTGIDDAFEQMEVISEDECRSRVEEATVGMASEDECRSRVEEATAGMIAEGEVQRLRNEWTNEFEAQAQKRTDELIVQLRTAEQNLDQQRSVIEGEWEQRVAEIEERAGQRLEAELAGMVSEAEVQKRVDDLNATIEALGNEITLSHNEFSSAQEGFDQQREAIESEWSERLDAEMSNMSARVEDLEGQLSLTRQDFDQERSEIESEWGQRVGEMEAEIHGNWEQRVAGIESDWEQRVTEAQDRLEGMVERDEMNMHTDALNVQIDDLNRQLIDADNVFNANLAEQRSEIEREYDQREEALHVGFTEQIAEMVSEDEAVKRIEEASSQAVSEALVGMVPESEVVKRIEEALAQQMSTEEEMRVRLEAADWATRDEEEPWKDAMFVLSVLQQDMLAMQSRLEAQHGAPRNPLRTTHRQAGEEIRMLNNTDEICESDNIHCGLVMAREILKDTSE